ncbi:MAG: hypothetical protein KDC38_04500 [Planctomycetes bacterium]|nr:hypothetical protein [Planctomycetota bacterium]
MSPCTSAGRELDEMVSTPSEHFHLVLPRDASLEVGPASRGIAPILGMHPTDLATRLRYGGGWVIQSVPESIATRVIDWVRDELGVTLHRIPDDLPLSPSVRRRANALRADASSLTIRFGVDEEHYELADFEAIGVALLGGARKPAAPTDKDPVSTASRPGETHLLDALTVTSRSALLGEDEIDLRHAAIYLAVPEPVEWIVAELGVVGLTDAWIRLVEHLVEWTPDDILLPETRRFIEARDRSAVLFEKPEEIERRLQWIGELIARDLWRRGE